MVQLILTAVVLAGIAGIVFLLIKLRQNEHTYVAATVELTMEDFMNDALKHVVNSSIVTRVSSLGDEAYELDRISRLQFGRDLDDARHAIPKALNNVLGPIRAYAEQSITSVEDACSLIDFQNPQYMPGNYLWETLLYILSRKGIKTPFEYLCKTYQWNKEKVFIDDSKRKTHQACVTLEELAYATMQELDGRQLDLSEMLDIMSLITLHWKFSLNVCTTLRTIDIDGFHYGARGSVRYKIENNSMEPDRDTNSITVQKWGVWIALPFLDFGSVDVMKQVTDQMTSWGINKDMSERQPFKVNDSWDGARITAIIPSAGESYGCFIRMFSKGFYNKENWFNNPMVHNWQLPFKLTYFIMRAGITSAVTGPQNSGKTTLLKILIGDTERQNIRALEMSFELNLREIYKNRDIFTVKTTDYVNAMQLQDLLKKTDAALSLVGEVADNVVAARMIQFCLIASAFTLFSHHALDDDALVNGLADSLVASGEYEDHNVAVNQVLDAIKSNIHINFVNGQRVIEYVSEIIKSARTVAYPTMTSYVDEARKLLGPDATDIAITVLASSMLNREFYGRTTDRVRFKSNKILIFDAKTMTYKANMRYTDETLNLFCKKLKGEDLEDFIKFYEENWCKPLPRVA